MTQQIDFDLLQDLLSSDMMMTDAVKQKLNMIKKEKVLTIHNYAVTTPKDKNARWQTYVMKGEKRSKISATTEEGLYQKLYEFYYKKNISMELLYPEWLDKRKEANVNARTVARNKNHWDKYYKQHKIVKVPIQSITTDMVEKFFNECIKSFSLTLKELNNMKFIMKDMFKMAKRRGYIFENPFNDIEINTNACRPANKQNDISRVYLPEEQERFFLAINEEIRKHPETTDCYAITLLFKLGVRIGELCALQWKDIDMETSEIHIHRMETLEENELGKMVSAVVPYTKKKSPYGDRFLPLGEYELAVLHKVKQINEEYGYKEDDYIFCDEKGRTKIREIDNRIRKICNHANIVPEKSAHDIRRTVATQMHMQGIPIRLIQEYLGHSDTKTTWGYIVNNQKKQEVHAMIKDSLKNLNGLMGIQSF